MIIAIDGYACTGKSTVAEELAKKMNFIHINSGMLYRAITLYLYNNGITTNNINLQLNNIEKLVNSIDFETITYSTDSLKQQFISDLGSHIAQIPAVRAKVSEELHRIASVNNVIIDGRDIGSNEFPNAEHKYFFEVSTIERAKRLIKERRWNYSEGNLNKCIDEIEQRDSKDVHRENSPLRKADDAIVINRDNLSVDETVSLLYQKCNSNR